MIDLDTVRDVAEHVFVPFTVGGGIRDLDDMFAVLKAGAEKISVDSMAVRNPDIIRAAPRRSAPVHRALDPGQAGRRPRRHPERLRGLHRRGAHRHRHGRRGVGPAGAELGAGEIVVNSIDADGTAAGYELAITRAVADAVNVPVIASGAPAPSNTSPPGSPTAAPAPRSSARSSTHPASSGTSASAS